VLTLFRQEGPAAGLIDGGGKGKESGSRASKKKKKKTKNPPANPPKKKKTKKTFYFTENCEGKRLPSLGFAEPVEVKKGRGWNLTRQLPAKEGCRSRAATRKEKQVVFAGFTLRRKGTQARGVFLDGWSVH